MAEKKVFRSLIKKFIPKELFQRLYELTLMFSVGTNPKAYEIKRLLTEYGVPYTSLGPGTNRIGVLIDGYAFKIAMDRDGCIDNQREFKYSPRLYPYVIKVHEISYGGLIIVTEYVNIFSQSDLYKYEDEMRKILKMISTSYFIGDVGITKKNYVNWGIRKVGTENQIVIMDFAYIYSVKYGIYRCNCPANTLLEYDENYNTLHCPTCKKKYTFGEVRRRITDADQKNEIGDLRTIGYVVHGLEEELPINHRFTETIQEKTGEHEKENEIKKLIREHKEDLKRQKEYDELFEEQTPIWDIDF